MKMLNNSEYAKDIPNGSFIEQPLGTHNSPDFIIKVKENTGNVKTYVIEVKPKKQTRPPKPRKNVTKSYLYECKTYAVNQAKWTAADAWCKDRKIEFKIVTEQELGINHGR